MLNQTDRAILQDYMDNLIESADQRECQEEWRRSQYVKAYAIKSALADSDALALAQLERDWMALVCEACATYNDYLLSHIGDEWILSRFEDAPEFSWSGTIADGHANTEALRAAIGREGK